MMEVGRFSPRKENKSRRYCSVFNCSSIALKDLDVRFHLFPKPKEHFVDVVNEFGYTEKVDKLQAWIKALKIGKKVSSSMRVCSLHFTKDDYVLPNVRSKKRYLKKNAIPSCNLPTSSVMSKSKHFTLDEGRLKRRQARDIKKLETKNQQEEEDDPEEKEGEKRISAAEPEDDEIVNQMSHEDQNHRRSFQDIGVQVQSGDLLPKFVQFLKTDSELSTFTGIESFDILNAIIDLVALIKPEDNKAKLSMKDKVVMTYVKLKQNMSYVCLAILFNCCTAKQCQRIFTEMIHILSKCLKVAISWPSEEEISKNLPQCFEDFKDVRVVLDCTEVFLQKPKNLCCQLSTYSHYKGTFTCKFLTGVTPAGNISFISKPYGGRASDKAIFEQSNLKDLLLPGNAVMVDRGFLIDDICKMNGWKCIRPPFLKNKKQFTKSEAILTSKIACARVHIERSNQRIKAFQIVGGRLPVNLVPLVEEIFTVICATVNLNSPILMDDKFLQL